jgi:hypothetical protein
MARDLNEQAELKSRPELQCRLPRRQLKPGTDCVAGHIGFELANPSASYLIVIAWQLRLRWAQLGWQRHFAFQRMMRGPQPGSSVSQRLSWTRGSAS